jgi:hypothetical protein
MELLTISVGPEDAADASAGLVETSYLHRLDNSPYIEVCTVEQPNDFDHAKRLFLRPLGLPRIVGRTPFLDHTIMSKVKVKTRPLLI